MSWVRNVNRKPAAHTKKGPGHRFMSILSIHVYLCYSAISVLKFSYLLELGKIAQGAGTCTWQPGFDP